MGSLFLDRSKIQLYDSDSTIKSALSYTDLRYTMLNRQDNRNTYLYFFLSELKCLTHVARFPLEHEVHKLCITNGELPTVTVQISSFA